MATNYDTSKYHDPVHVLSSTEKLYLDQTFKALSSAAFSRYEGEYRQEIVSAHNKLGKCIAELHSEDIKFSEDECEMSCHLHTYMRKYMDNPLSCVLYRLLSNNTSTIVWKKFVSASLKLCNQNGINFLKKAKSKKEPTKTIEFFVRSFANVDGNLTDSDFFLYHSLQCWELSSYTDAIEMYVKYNIKENEKGS